jgi:hypothetical protein
MAGLESPVAGAQEHEMPPEPTSAADAPWQMAALPEATAVGSGFTVMAALPEEVPGPFASEIDVTVYVVVAAGETERVAGFTVMPF